MYELRKMQLVRRGKPLDKWELQIELEKAEQATN